MFIKTNGELIKLNISKFDDETRKLLHQYIPDIEIFDKLKSDNVQNSLEITIDMSKKNNYSVFSKNVIYSASEIIPADIMGIVSRNAEYLYAKKGDFSVHSSCIDIDGKTILIAGRAGAGKTTLMMNLIKYNSDAKIISGDRTVISGGKTAVAGTKVLNFREQSLKDEFPHLEQKLDVYKVGTRIKLSPNNSPFKYQMNPKDVDAIVYPQKHDGTFTGRELKMPESLTRLANQGFHFLEEFPRLLLGTKSILTTDVKTAHKNYVLKNMDVFASNVKSYSISGNLDNMVEYIRGEIL